MTYDLFSSPYDQMLVNSGKDINDLGFPDRCRQMYNSPMFYIMTVGVQQLPLSLKLGMCLPRECTTEVMDVAMQELTTTSNLILGPIIKDIPVKLPTSIVPVFEFHAINSEKWVDEQRTQNSTYAYIAMGVLAILIIFTIVGSIYFELTHESYPTTEKVEEDSFNENFERKLMSQNSMSTHKGATRLSSNIQDESSKHHLSVSIHSMMAFNYKPKKVHEIARTAIECCLYESVTNPIQKHPEIRKKVTEDRHTRWERFLLEKYLKFKEKHYFRSIVSCFSLQLNIKSLNMSKRNDEEHKELEVLEGIRTLSMFWGVFTATSLYVLVAHVQNIFEMLRLFESLAFTMIASGNLSPDLFLFIGTFLGFVKINHLYDARNGISVLTYLKLVFYRYAKLAPLYYFVFFTGWAIFPFLSNADTWYLSETLFYQ